MYVTFILYKARSVSKVVNSDKRGRPNVIDAIKMGSGEHSATSAVVERLNQAAKEQLESGNYEKALEHYVSAVEESERIKNQDIEYACLLNAGACMVSLGRCKEGLQLLERAIDIVDASGKELDRDSAATHADVYFNAGVAAQELKDVERAVSYFNLSLELYLAFSLKHYANEACSNLAKCYRHLGNTEKEVDALQASQKLCHDLGYCDAEALACGELVVAYLLANKITECRQALCTAKMMCLRSTNPKTQGEDDDNLSPEACDSPHRTIVCPVWTGVHSTGSV